MILLTGHISGAQRRNFSFYAVLCAGFGVRCEGLRPLLKLDIMMAESTTSGSSSVVERDLAKVEVAGSTPVSRSRFGFPGPSAVRGFALQGAVPKW